MIIWMICAVCGDEFEIAGHKTGCWQELRAHYMEIAHEQHRSCCPGRRKLLYRTVLSGKLVATKSSLDGEGR